MLAYLIWVILASGTELTCSRHCSVGNKTQVSCAVPIDLSLDDKIIHEHLQQGSHGACPMPTLASPLHPNSGDFWVFVLGIEHRGVCLVVLGLLPVVLRGSWSCGNLSPALFWVFGDQGGL